MPSNFSVDLISDLYLDKTEQFDWTGKPTSLFCVIAGNLSDDIATINHTLEHLSNLYRGVFYIDGSYEHLDLDNFERRVTHIKSISKTLKNVVYMHNQVVVLNNVAFIGVNGWYNNNANITCVEDSIRLREYKTNDLGYLSNSIRTLQMHKDADKIVIVSASVPSDHFLFNNTKFTPTDCSEPGLALVMDTGHKVTHWMYGGTEIVTDNVHNNRRYLNNPRIKGQPYWPKRVTIV